MWNNQQWYTSGNNNMGYVGICFKPKQLGSFRLVGTTAAKVVGMQKVLGTKSCFLLHQIRIYTPKNKYSYQLIQGYSHSLHLYQGKQKSTSL